MSQTWRSKLGVFFGRVNPKFVRPNAVRISNYTYLIRTQAGFRRTLKRLYPTTWKMVEGYPQSYPSVVVFANGYRGYHYPQCYCTPARLMLEVLRNS